MPTLQYIKSFLYLLFLSNVLIFTACSSNQFQKCKNPIINEISDLKELSQNPAYYTKSLPVFDCKRQKQMDEEFNKLYFGPWDLKTMTNPIDKANCGNMYAKRKMYAANHQLISKEWFNKQIKNSNFDKYNTISTNAVTTNNSNLRVFPTTDLMFYNPQKPGEGYPFDYNQNSSIKINTPLFISHFSQDRAWVFVESNFATGWLNIKDIAFIDNVLINKFKSGTYFVAIKDNFPIYKNGMFIDYIKMGTIFPLRNNKLVTINKSANLQGYLSYVKIPDIYIQKKPLKFNQNNINQISNSLIAEPYGWGGLMNNRDCSALTKDFFTPFGIYLKRNSFQQTQLGQYIELKDLSFQQKKEQILKNAMPFLTLIYLKDHIMLYIGKKNGEPLVLHNFWGVKTLEDNGDEGRFIVGRTVITTLEPGRELPNYFPSKNILAKIEGMVLVTEKTLNE